MIRLAREMPVRSTSLALLVTALGCGPTAPSDTGDDHDAAITRDATSTADRATTADVAAPTDGAPDRDDANAMTGDAGSAIDATADSATMHDAAAGHDGATMHDGATGSDAAIGHDGATGTDAAIGHDGATGTDAAIGHDGATGTDAGGTSPSGQPMPVGDLPGWHQIFADDFTTDVPLGHFPAAVSTRWGGYEDGWTDTSRHGTYMPSRVISIAGGLMNMHLHTEGSVHMVAAPIPILPGTSGSGGMLHGRYTARFRATSAAGYKTAWLLWPDSETWPRDGEIDFPEGDLDSTIGAFMHRQNGTSGGDQDGYRSTARYTSWHTMTLEWTATSCRFEIDGATIGNSTNRIPDTSMHWVLQTETAIDGTVPSATAVSDVQLDWVAVYAPR